MAFSNEQFKTFYKDFEVSAEIVSSVILEQKTPVFLEKPSQPGFAQTTKPDHRMISINLNQLRVKQIDRATIRKCWVV